MNLPAELRYARTHEWVRIEDGVAIVGITDFAQDQLSDVTYVELPSVGDQLAVGEECAVVESVKAASDIYAPVSGGVIEINESLNDQPELINQDPYGSGWMFKLEPENLEDMQALMTAAQYEKVAPEAD
ncbi:MAG: glycine cleavage system protein GcvH [Kiritimatiellae bacterium]|nr:glycine cleavage system protein GcvH [Kiritimatiellia bacterium]